MSVSLGEVAVAWWRLDKWVRETDVEKKMSAESSLRKIKLYLDEQGIEIKDLEGQKYDIGLPIEEVGSVTYSGRGDDISAPEIEENLYISEMVRPIVLQNGHLLMFGRAVLRGESER